MADSSVVEERVSLSLSLSLSLTLAVHMVQTGVHVGVDRGNSHTTDNRRVDSSMDRGYSGGDYSTDSGIRVHSMADCSVVEERVSLSLSLSLSLTLAVHVVQTGVHVGVDRGNSHTTDNRRVDSSMDRGYSVGDSSTDSGYSVGNSSDSRYS